jgi:hypothetical protein
LTKPKKRPIDAASLARAYTEDAVNTLAGIMKRGGEEANRTRAAQVLLDRGWGKPAQDNTVSGELKITIRKLLDGKK